MRRVIIPLMALLFVAFIINGCKNKQQGEKQEKTKRTSISVDKNDLTGIWLRITPGSSPEKYEGFDLKEDGALTYQNAPTIFGDSWVLNHDTLVLYSKTDNVNSPRPSHFIIHEIIGNKLSLKPMRTTGENLQIYRRSEVSLANMSPEEALAAYIYFLNNADVVGVQSLMIVNRSFSISKPMNITSYKILSTAKLTEQAAAAIDLSPKLKEGDVQFEVEQVVEGVNTMNYTYWLREEGFGNWGLVIWSYKRGN